MKGMYRVLIVAALTCAVGIVFMMKHETSAQQTIPTTASPESEPTKKALPRLVDLGAGKCIPCKMMAPLLEELGQNYAESFDVTFIDVWENPEAGEQYGIRMIPTQIFYDAAGKELFRHEGFFSRESILKQWNTLGVAVATKTKE